MAAQEFQPHHRGTPAQFASRRALNPAPFVTAIIILLLIVGLGKVSWAVKAYDHQVDLYQINAAGR